MSRKSFVAAAICSALSSAGLLASSASGQVAGPVREPVGVNSSAMPRDIARLRTEFTRVRTQMEAVQRDFDRAARTNQPAVREAALVEWQRALDGLEPYVKELSPTVPDEQPFIAQYNEWIALYNDAVGPAQAGEFFLQISKMWNELTAGTEGWEQENSPITFGALTQAKPEDATVKSLGMPKTVAFVTAANTYLANVAARPDYGRFKNAPNVKQDRQQVEAALGRAHEKLAKAADRVLAGAAEAKLDQDARDRLNRFVEEDLAVGLAGYRAQPIMQARGRTAVFSFDRQALGEAQAVEKLKGNLTAAADRAWPSILAKYATTPMAPEGAGRGQVVRITGATNRIGKEFGIDTYDFAGYVDGAPVVGNYAAGVQEQVDTTLSLTNAKTLPEDATYDMIAVIRGTAQVPNVRQRPGATTAPATADEVTAATAPAVTDCVVLEIVALHAGPVAIGTEVVATPMR